jgi:hypothetical protein
LPSSARALYLPGFYHGPFLSAGLAIVRARRMKLIMDGNSSEELRLAEPSVLRAVQGVDVFMPNAGEARRITGQDDLMSAIRVLADVCSLVVVKDGASGAHAYADRQLHHSPAIPVTPIDTTGAGDCFNAGFIRTWLDNLPLDECSRWGNVVGGLSTLAHGGAGKAVTPEEVRRWLQ